MAKKKVQVEDSPEVESPVEDKIDEVVETPVVEEVKAEEPVVAPPVTKVKRKVTIVQ